MENSAEQKGKLTEIEINSCISVLEHLLENGDQLIHLSPEQLLKLMKAAGQITRPDKAEIYKRNKSVKVARKQAEITSNRNARAATSIRSARIASVFEAPTQVALPASGSTSSEAKHFLTSEQNCYVCKKPYTEIHHFYDSMCKECGDLNYSKRFQSCDLTGQIALITGSRLKIGYHATLMMLRSGATVIATTRFPADSAIRFAKEKDFADWGHRLHIYGLDLRHIPSVELFASYVEQKYKRLDILINNAAQTVRRPAGFYTHLMDNELLPFHEHTPDVQGLLAHHQQCLHEIEGSVTSGSESSKALAVNWTGQAPGIGIRASAQLSQVPYRFDNSIEAREVFPEGKLDADLQQVDLRTTNSWRLKLGQIETLEMVEVQLVNSIAPFVLCNRLTELMRKDYTGMKHVVNVSAMEGKFHSFKKADRHPHTNMAKAALNMLTHTAASDLAKDGIFMNAVDTGWVTDEDPAELAKHKQQVHDFQPPLDIVDGAARVCDPFIDGINTGKHWSGRFLKDYFPISW
ncbi:SDR family NAD(P)-dependent oxidoreductase [Williamwhitmania taraxaci]|uniref:Enoyl-(Acyl carrier protein) reductase n=1 Tax=Williamwhitmania taraxaci TaxID=1640674 RepID=A0A1G6RTK8_9BACT|nr:SDR family oxidoreductase [Williamwhitmania taraxaci]SDD07285.1 Enoyl-(Acyl carrier protein) reductase [Williamwhitmania taraxaci]